MAREERIAELTALKTIAETLNVSNDMGSMLNEVLQKLLQVTGMTTGWIFLVGEHSEYTCAVDVNLPPALSWGEKTPMCQGSCWCLDRYWDGRLRHAVNIIECKRIEDAEEYKWGDTAGIVHHATVPLEAGGEWFGILNVGAPGKESFSEEELALLQSVAFQIGNAVKRTRLYQAQQKRADLFYKLDEFIAALRTMLEPDRIPVEAVRSLARTYGWSTVAFFSPEQKGVALRALAQEEKSDAYWTRLDLDEAGPLKECLQLQGAVLWSSVPQDADTLEGLAAIGLSGVKSCMAAPIVVGHTVVGVLWVSTPKARELDEHDLDVLQAIAEHVAMTIGQVQLDEERQQLTRMEERHRLARDLHDSVSQTLFSLRLNARGAEAMASKLGEGEALTEVLQEIQELAQSALREMRSLIWQLRPAGLEEGLVTALLHYGESLGVAVSTEVEGVVDLPRPLEEGLWRIGQEALNNIFKHSGVNTADLRLKVSSNQVRMSIKDEGVGIRAEKQGRFDQFGLISMRERAALLGGYVEVQSDPDLGTEVLVYIPIDRDGETKDEN